MRRDSPGSHRRHHCRSRPGGRAPEASGSPVHDRRRAVKEPSRRFTSARARAWAQAPPHGCSTAARSPTGEHARRREAPRRHRCFPLAATGGHRSVRASVRCGRKGGGEKKSHRPTHGGAMAPSRAQRRSTAPAREPPTAAPPVEPEKMGLGFQREGAGRRGLFPRDRRTAVHRDGRPAAPGATGLRSGPGGCGSGPSSLTGRAQEAAGPSAERSRPWAELGSRAEYIVNENFVFSFFPEAF